MQEKYSLEAYNTFGVAVLADYFSTFSTKKELIKLLAEHSEKEKLVLGSGSNILFTKNFRGIVLKNEIKGIKVLKETTNWIDIAVGAGLEWHSFVEYSLKNNWSGIENLSLIPGTVGAAPVQNIGAYGIEVKNVILEVNGYSISEKKMLTISNKDCKFSYRNSLFKNELKNNFVITNVVFRLSKIFFPTVSYKGLKERFLKSSEITANQVSEEVIRIRTEKLPLLSKFGNGGSFFKNPIIETKKFNSLAQLFPELPHYDLKNGTIKIPAAWLIEYCGWKGKSIGHVQAYEKQPLVLVSINKKANGKELFNFSEKIIASVKQRFGIVLEREINVL